MNDRQTPTEIELHHERTLAKYSLSLLTEDLLLRAYARETHRRWQDLGTMENLLEAIRRVVLTGEQTAWLTAHNLTLEELMRGQFPNDTRAEVDRVFCEVWNADIGAPVFGFLGQAEMA